MGFLDRILGRTGRASNPGAAPAAPTPARPTTAPGAKATPHTAPDTTAKPAAAPAKRATAAPAPAPAPAKAASAAAVAVAKPPAAKPVAPAPAKPVAQAAPKAPPRPAAPPPAPKRAATSSGRPGLSFFGSSKPPAGPLDLAPGDFVTHYKDRFAVVGVRVLEGDGAAQAFHYVMKDEKGAYAVLACVGAGPDLTIERPPQGDVKAEGDCVRLGDDAFKLAAKGRARLRAFEDAGVPSGCKSVDFQRFTDSSGDRVLCLDDFQGRKEARVGDAVFEAEMEFERASGAKGAGTMTQVMGGASSFEDAAEHEIVKGTPRAAAKALEENVGAKRVAKKPAGDDDSDTIGYDDDTWADAEDEQQDKAPVRAKVVAKIRSPADEEDEWVSATQLVRENGEVGGDEDDSAAGADDDN